jgi:hypothetical protein
MHRAMPEEDPADVVARCQRMRRSSSREPSIQNRDSAQLELSRGPRRLRRCSLARPTIAYASARMAMRAIASATLRSPMPQPASLLRSSHCDTLPSPSAKSRRRI